ncbi:unnamed protein product [Symbiodinium sp. CCMP2592]|nr:unnamed protein product [Symbiodinium sp. CCMP2592]
MTPQERHLVLKRLIKMGAPKDFIYLLILISSQAFFGGPPVWDVVDLFCGVGRISKLASRDGYEVASVDIGLLPAADKPTCSKKKKKPPMDVTSEAGFALACMLLLQGKFQKVVLVLGPVCSSFVPVNMGVSGRSILTPTGNPEISSVQKANVIVSRCCLLLLLVIAMEGTYVLEQPARSLMLNYPRLGQVIRMTREIGSKAYTLNFWMRAYGAKSMKRTVILSNDMAVAALHHGKLSRSQRLQAKPAAIYYRGKDGTRKFRGDKRLKDSQTYPPAFARAIVDMIPALRSRKRKLDVEDDERNLLECVKEMWWSEWGEADLWPTLVYLRGSKHLRLSPSWKEVMRSSRFRV